MSAKVLEVRSAPGDPVRGYLIWCPGCGAPHLLDFRFHFDGVDDAPTFAPAYSEVTFALAPGRCASRESIRRCGFAVVYGHLRYTDGCSHHLSGQTVPIPEWPWTAFARMAPAPAPEEPAPIQAAYPLGLAETSRAATCGPYGGDRY